MPRNALVGAGIVGVLLVAAVAAFVVLRPKPYRIPSESMVPTLTVGARVLGTSVSEPGRGEIVVFRPPRSVTGGLGEATCGVPRVHGAACSRPTPGVADTTFISRVVGLPGERLKVIQNRVFINGRRLRERSINANGACEDLCNLPREVTIPAGHFFVMGDNRGASLDSRAWGPVPKDAVLKKVRLRYWPPSEFGSP